MPTCQVSATPEASFNPSKRQCVVDHARSVCSEALADLAATNLSVTASDPRSTPDYWVGHLQFLLGYLLVVLDEAG